MIFNLTMFVILQKYDFSSKSQLSIVTTPLRNRCLWYCKSTIFQANHNSRSLLLASLTDVCDTAKVRFFKQITTRFRRSRWTTWMFVILQKYDFSSKSQLTHYITNRARDVCDTAKVRFFKQITTVHTIIFFIAKMFVILQKYDFSSKSQLEMKLRWKQLRCLWYCKSTIFQANHNQP